MTGRRVLLFITIFLFISFKSFSAVFTVTSNADSGPGTLREALTLAAANGSAEKDYIYFNLLDLSEAGRTISLATKLPPMTSNLVIDGSTQPGTKFGISDAKVQITFKFVYPDQLSVLSSDGAGFLEIYGLWINCDSTGWGGAGIGISNFNKVIVGAPTKGNIINGANVGIHTGKVCIYQNNNSGTDITGEQAGGGHVGISCDDVTVGGSPTTGNIFFKMDVSFENPSNNQLILSYNKFGTNYTGTKRVPLNLFSQITRLVVQGVISPGNEIPVNAVINNNIFVDEYAGILLSVTDLSGQVTIQGNSFNTDPTGTINYLANTNTIASMRDILLRASANILVGGDDPAQKNLIAYGGLGIDYGSYGKYAFKRNSIFCVDEITGTSYNRDKLPLVKITSVSDNQVAGTATPNADIELFNSDCSCNLPNPKKYFTTVKADANGKWTFNGPVNGYVMASATFNNLTGLFTGLEIDDSKAIITNFTCTAKGSITGIKTPYTTGISWYNEQNQPVGNSIDLKDVPAGNYTLKINTGTPCQLTKQYQIVDKSLVVDASNIYIKPASCGSSNGLIWGIKTNVPAILTWHGANMGGTVYGTEVSNVPAGNYTFTFTNLDGSCPQTISPIIVKSVDGPNIDQSHPDIRSTSCGQSTGSIKNIIVTGAGNIKYSWLNAQHQEVANTNDLTGQPAGVYTLKVTDDSQCGEIYSSEINIPETNGITLNENSVTRVPATCSQNNGSIKGITAPGATHYKWINTATNNQAGSSPDLADAAAGSYQLIASNDFGCSKPSQVYTIDAIPVTVYPNYAANVTNSCSGQNSGSITLTTDPLVKTMRWIDGNGQPAGTDANPHGLKPGTYKVYFTDASGCETLYPHDFTVNEIDPLQIVANSETRTDDQCGLNTGGIKNIQVKGGTQPYTYLWLNVAGEHLVTSQDLTDVGAGDYTLQVQDASGCGVMASRIYTVLNENSSMDAPVIAPLQLCAPGEALLSVSSPSAGNTYRLYDSQTSTQYQDEQTNGIFKIKANPNSTYYISQVSGQCESERTQAQITISLSAIDIPNAFTPNGDGKNDYWKINNAQNYPQAIVQIFTRYGQKVFESKGYSVPFDGTYNGTKLPSGVYYYILNLGKSCNLLSGSLSIIR
ncbi:gliding motility-associated C-terminal domain-containing protein [Mucilaginibacter gossypii]|uniref:gliding motility-associated C-terminal domain-containing protein n=1 Tax=Mucilaginibacter gossypii TaxID=551996 RepID=UPI000DCE2501|nr:MULTISPECIES: gliding motility-associated C-terminal domain-containing protein [Mucilaginibacter]QTE36844.1 gliding motility-associated C-terminal domain-containing protein [Mucilaginibacter gossypii]RAV59221.1 hypothetical protein DIU36_07055 [Mucilaginibacter rubeus]